MKSKKVVPSSWHVFIDHSSKLKYMNLGLIYDPKVVHQLIFLNEEDDFNPVEKRIMRRICRSNKKLLVSVPYEYDLMKNKRKKKKKKMKKPGFLEYFLKTSVKTLKKMSPGVIISFGDEVLVNLVRRTTKDFRDQDFDEFFKRKTFLSGLTPEQKFGKWWVTDGVRKMGKDLPLDSVNVFGLQCKKMFLVDTFKQDLENSKKFSKIVLSRVLKWQRFIYRDIDRDNKISSVKFVDFQAKKTGSE